jgi:hypothetical protein
MRSLAASIKFETINDIVAATALVRPGPMASGQTALWLERRNGAPVDMHPLFEPILRDTLGVVIYQEQVMAIGRQVGDLSWAEVTGMRKAMGKSLGKNALDRYGDPWRRAAVAKGLTEDAANKWWADLCEFGLYGFNKSHSVAYAHLSYWCAWFKAHHPVEYACAVLDYQDDTARQIEILRELKREGIEYVPVDRERSIDRWLPDGNRVVGPLSSIKGFGPKRVAEVIRSRVTGKQLSDGVYKLLHHGATKIGSLTPIADYIGQRYPDGLRKLDIGTEISPIEALVEGDEDKLIAVVPTKFIMVDENDAKRVLKRGHEVTGPRRALIVRVRDDTGELLIKVGRYNFVTAGLQFIERGGLNKSIWALKGSILKDFKLMMVKQSHYLGAIA